MQSHTADKRALVLALGGGGARGLAHIGVLQELAAADIPVRAVVGTSIGAEIGAFLASGMPLDELEALATGFDWKQTLQLFLPDLPAGGLVSGRKIMDFLTERLGNRSIQDLAMGFAAIATDLDTGEEVVLDRGLLSEVVRASISVPGLLAPSYHAGRFLVDGGAVNPVPFDVARRRFGGPVLAVGVHSGARGMTRRDMHPERSSEWARHIRQLLVQPWMSPLEPMRAWLEAQMNNHVMDNGQRAVWRVREVLDQMLAITQAQIVRLRALDEPPDILLTPDVSRIDMLDFYRGAEAVAAGRRAVTEQLPQIRALTEG